MLSLEIIKAWPLLLSSKQLPQAYRVEEIEALVVARALEFAFEIGIDSAVLEGNSELIIKALTDEDPLCRHLVL